MVKVSASTAYTLFEYYEKNINMLGQLCQQHTCFVTLCFGIRGYKVEVQSWWVLHHRIHLGCDNGEVYKVEDPFLHVLVDCECHHVHAYLHQGLYLKVEGRGWPERKMPDLEKAKIPNILSILMWPFLGVIMLVSVKCLNTKGLKWIAHKTLNTKGMKLKIMGYKNRILCIQLPVMLLLWLFLLSTTAKEFVLIYYRLNVFYFFYDYDNFYFLFLILFITRIYYYITTRFSTFASPCKYHIFYFYFLKIKYWFWVL